MNIKDEHYFRSIVVDNLKFTALVEFISGTFTFSFIAELTIQPIVLVLLVLQIMAEKGENNKAFKHFLDTVIIVFGLALVYFTIKEAITSFVNLNMVDLLLSFAIPLVFSAIYLPIVYLFAVHARYQVLFIRLTFKSPKSKGLQLKHKWEVVATCGLLYKEIYRFEKDFL